MNERRIGLGISAILVLSACNALVGVDTEVTVIGNGGVGGAGGDGGGMAGMGGSSGCKTMQDCEQPSIETCRAMDCVQDACVEVVIKGELCGVGRGCDSNGLCQDQKGIGGPCLLDSDCLSGTCNGQICTGQSCAGLPANCGPNGAESCCATRALTGNKFNRDNGTVPDDAVGDFGLDRYEVTVGRFRKFVAAYSGAPPSIGAGANPHAQGTGWDAGWDQNMPLNKADYDGFLEKCNGDDSATWTNVPGANETLPINCVSWYDAFAFCAWDGGRLPTDLEWAYAAVGGSARRQYPWGMTPAPDAQHCAFACDMSPMGCGLEDIFPVGSFSTAGDGFWEHADLSGNMAEWVFDTVDVAGIAICENCVTNGPGDRILRGGSWRSPAGGVTSTSINQLGPDSRGSVAGFRCARGLPVCGDGIVDANEACDDNSADPAVRSGCKNCDKVAKIVAGEMHTCAITHLGKLKCWGNNDNGELGQGHTDVVKDPQTIPFIEIGRVRDVALSLHRTCALLENGNVQCFGANSLDNDAYKDLLGSPMIVSDVGDAPGEMRTPVNVFDFMGSVTKIVSGRYHSCALLKDGKVRCWGSNVNGRLGIGTVTPVPAGGAGPRVFDTAVVFVDDIAASYDSTCARWHSPGGIANQGVYCWGLDVWADASAAESHGVLGLNVASEYARGDDAGEMSAPALLPTILPSTAHPVGAISGLGNGYCVLNANMPEARCWGQNNHGQLGRGSQTPWGAGEFNTDMLMLTPIDVGMGFEITQIVAGRTHTCVVLTAGRLKCFGSDQFGELGLGRPPPMNKDQGLGDSSGEMGNALPEVLLGSDEVKQLSLGLHSTCALFQNDRVKCWGANQDGQTGVLPDDIAVGDAGPVPQPVRDIPYVDPL